MGEITIKEEAKKKPKRKHYGWRIALSFVCGFVSSGIIAVAAIGIFTAVTPAKQVVNMAGGNPEEILGLDYQDSTILKIVIDATNTKFETLGDINKFTPMVEKLVTETINPLLEDNIHFAFDWEELSRKPFDKELTGDREDVDYGDAIGDYIPVAIEKGVTLSSFLDPDGNHSNMLLNLFLYASIEDGDGTLLIDYDDPVTIYDLMTAGSDFFTDLINKIRIGDIIEIDESNGFLSQIKNWKLSDFNDQSIKSLKIGPLFTQDQLNDNPLLKTIYDKNWTINDLADFDNLSSLKIGEIIDLSNADGLMATLSNYTLSDLMTKDLLNEITIGQIYPNATGIMAELSSYTIASLSNPDTFMGIKLEKIFTDLTDDNVLYQFKDKTLKELSEIGLDDIKLAEIFTEAQIDSNPVIAGIIAKNPNATVNDLADYELMSTLLISDIIPQSDIDNNPVLQVLVAKNTTIGGLSDGVLALKVSEVFDVSQEPDNSIKKKIITALGDYNILSIADHFGELKMSDFINIDSSSSQILQTLSDVTLDELPSVINNLTFADVMKIDGDSPLNKDEIKNIKISDCDSFFEALKSELALGDLMEIDSNSPLLLQKLANCTLNDMEDTLKTLTLSDVVNITDSSSNLLKALAGAHIFGSSSDIEDKLSNLKFNDVFSETDCSGGIMKSIWDNNNDGDFSIADMESAIQHVLLTDILGDALYEEVANQKISPTWWMLLTEEGETFTAEEKYKTLKNGASYTMKDFDKLMLNMKFHMSNDTLFELIESKFITVDPAKAYKLDIVPLGCSKKLGEFTISEFMDYCLTLVTI